MMRVINVDDVTVVKNSNVILNNISFDVEMGSFISIVGNNGSGKSTLIRSLLGLENYNGYININGYYLDEVGIYDIRKGVSAVLDDKYQKFLGNTVKDTLIINLVHLGKSDKYINNQIDDICDLFNIDKSILNKKMALLNNRMRQKILIAAAIISKPSILLLDNCLHRLNDIDKKMIMKILNKLRKEDKMTIIMTTNDMEDILFGDNVIVMDKGRIIVNSTIKNLYKYKDKIEDCGIRLPFVIDLSCRLLDNGLINNVYVDKRKLVDELWK